MGWADVHGWVEVAFFSLFFILAEWPPLNGAHWRAALRVATATLPFAVGWPVVLASFPSEKPWLSAWMAAGIFAFLLDLFFPWSKPRGIRIVSTKGRVDERDVIFSRMELKPGTPQYTEYYSRRPELEAVDERLRSLPRLGMPGGRFFDPLATPLANACFHIREEAGKLAEERAPSWVTAGSFGSNAPCQGGGPILGGEARGDS